VQQFPGKRSGTHVYQAQRRFLEAFAEDVDDLFLVFRRVNNRQDLLDRARVAAILW
jgi:hypothetical protein